MIIIFLNELKNLTLSFLKINYLKDVADINIQKHCNNIYCEAETGRFSLAKNSFDLLLPNDNFNTKTYYYTILFIIVLLFIDLFYKFWKYNDRFVPYLSNVDGEYFITYLKSFPYILLFVVIFILAVMIIRRYAPTSSKGYKAYFNTDNDIISDEVDSYNINVILEFSKNIIIIFVILYIFCGFFSAIPSVPYISRIDGINYFYFAMAYIFIVLLCFYMMVNIINITMTFTDNNKPDLEYINLPEILKSEVEELNVLSDNDIIKLVTLNIQINIDNSYFNANGGNFSNHVYYNIRDKVYEVDISLFTENPGDKITLKNDNGEDEVEKENLKYIHMYIYSVFDGKKLDDAIKQKEIKFDSMIDKLILSISTGTENNSIYKFFGFRDGIKEIETDYNNIYTFGNKTYNNLIDIVCNLTKVLIKKDLLNKHSDMLDVNDAYELYENYLKSKIKLELFHNISKLQNNYIKRDNLSNEDAYNFIIEYKKYLSDSRKLDEEGDTTDIKLLYNDNLKIFKTDYENNETYTVDISYNSKNKYYENYFKISNGENIQLNYNVGNYQIKNMEGLLSYIIMFIVISLVLLLIVYSITTTTTIFNSYNIFTGEVISPLFILFIFILFIYIFINFSTKYNLYFINGIFDSSYKRDLTHLNNTIIPFIKLHDNGSEELSNDYLDNYIITNILVSIINGNLILYKDNTLRQNSNDPLDINDKFQDNANISSRKIKYKIYNEIDTSDKVEFDSYYKKLFKKTYDYFEGDNENYNRDGITNYIYAMVKYNETDNLTKILATSGANADSINSYIEEIINDYKDKIIDIIYICKHIFNPNNFKKHIAEYNDNISDGHENKLMSYFSFELTENKMEVLPYKFLLNLNTKANYDEFLKYKDTFQIINIVTKPCIFDIEYYHTLSDNEKDNKYMSCNNTSETNIATIVHNFLLILSHMKYNYKIIDKYIDDYNGKSSLTVLYNSSSDTDTFKEKINKLHNYENKRLFGLLKESLYKNDDKIIKINDTFRPTYDSKPVIKELYQNLKYNYKMLESYISDEVTTNNYLKNVIKTIYKEINDEDINFVDDSSSDKFKININKSDLAKPVDTILHKANNIIAEGLFTNYITNIIIIIIMYNIGNNI